MTAAGDLLPRRVSRWAVLTGVVAVSVVFDTGTADAFGLPKMLALWAATVVAVAAWVLASRQRRSWLPRSRFAVLAAIHVAVVAVATALSVSRIDSLVGSYERYGGLLSLVLCVGLGLLVVGLWWDQPDGLSQVAVAITVAAAIATGYLLLQAAGLDWIDWREASGIKAQFQGSTLGNSDFAGGFLGVALPFVLFMAGSARGRLRAALLVLAGAEVAGVIVTRSRGGLLALAVGGAVLIASHWRTLPPIVRWAATAAAAVILAGALVVLIAPSLATSSGLDRTGLLRTKSLSIRAREWRAAWQVFVHHPVLGTGPDTFEYSFTRYRDRADGAELGLQIADKPHNVLLEHATDTGLLGLATYLAVVIAALLFAVRRLRHSEGRERALLAAFLAGLAAYLAPAVVSFDVPPLAAFGWICLGGLAVLADPLLVERRSAAPVDRRSAKSRERGRYPSTGWTVLVCTVAGGLLLVALRPLAADLDAASAQKARDRSVAARHWRTAIGSNATQAAYRLDAGFTAEARGAEAGQPGDRAQFLEGALEQYQEAKRLAP